MDGTITITSPLINITKHLTNCRRVRRSTIFDTFKVGYKDSLTALISTQGEIQDLLEMEGYCNFMVSIFGFVGASHIHELLLDGEAKLTITFIS